MPWMAAIVTKLKRAIVFLIEDVSMLSYLVGFVAITIIFGITYAYLTPIGHGIGQNLKPVSDASFLIGIYFSVVTITSLGYGNMHPMGFSMALASMEVVLGLGLIGVMIAKVTSYRLSYHVSRLFSSDAQKRLEDIAANYEKTLGEIKTITPRFEESYHVIPGQTQKPEDRKLELISVFSDLTGELRLRCIELYDYISFETERGDYFKVAPVNEMIRIGKVVEDTFFVLSQLIISLSPQAKTETFDRQNRQRILDAIDLTRKVCNLVKESSADEAIKNVYNNTKSTCNQVPSSYFEVPEESQPNQLLQGTEDPQENPGG